MKNIYVTGYIGSDRKACAEEAAAQTGGTIVDLDKMIERNDGRKIMRIVMMMGEHEYRNKEYEALEELSEQEDLVVICSDGTLFDDMCREIMEAGEVRIADAEKTAEELWQNAKEDASIPYAFMQMGSEDEKKARFMKMYEARKDLYEKYTK